MAILLLFEKSDSLSYSELHATTKIADDQFPRYVQSLLEAKLLDCNTEVGLLRDARNHPLIGARRKVLLL